MTNASQKNSNSTITRESELALLLKSATETNSNHSPTWTQIVNAILDLLNNYGKKWTFTDAYEQNDEEVFK